MDCVAFSTTLAVAKPTSSFTANTVSTRRPTLPAHHQSKNDASTIRASRYADIYQWKSQTKEAKEAVTSTGVYGVQCTEGASKSSDADTKRILNLGTQFRLRQTSLNTKYRDLYETRRAAIINSEGSHTLEQYAINYPARASANVLGTSEAMGACSRYMPTQPNTSQYLMQECVDRQYKQMKIPYGEYTTMCNDGTVKFMSESTRIAALNTSFRANQLSVKQKTQMRYNAIKQATSMGFGCSYEESYFQRFPAMASAMRCGNGTYAAKVIGNLVETKGNVLSLEEQIKSDNVLSYWPSYLTRPAIEKPSSDTKFWTTAPSPIKSYAYMSAAAVEWGLEVQPEPESVKAYENVWEPGWQPKSSLAITASSDE